MASASMNLPSEPTAPQPNGRSHDEITALFLRSLLQRGEDFLENKVNGTVVNVPLYFDNAEQAALEKLAVEPGVNVLQLLDEAGGTAVTASDISQPTTSSEDHIYTAHRRSRSPVESLLLLNRQNITMTI